MFNSKRISNKKLISPTNIVVPKTRTIPVPTRAPLKGAPVAPSKKTLSSKKKVIKKLEDLSFDKAKKKSSNNSSSNKNVIVATDIINKIVEQVVKPVELPPPPPIEVIDINSLGDQNVNGLCIRLEEDISGWRNKGWEMILISLRPYGDSSYALYIDGSSGIKNGTYIKKFTKVSKIIDSKKTDKLIKLYRDYMINNLYTNLGHNFNTKVTPQIFIENEEGNNIPAFLCLPSVEKPTATPSNVTDYKGNNHFYNGNGGASMFNNGFYAKWNPNEKACLGYVMDGIASGMRGVYEAARKEFPTAKLSIKTVMDIPNSILENADDNHIKMDNRDDISNVYGIKYNITDPRKISFRAASGHIRFGNAGLSKTEIIKCIESLDAIVGVMCVSLFANLDDPRRRSITGFPGDFSQKVGIEYQALSNAWLCHPMITNFVLDIARKAFVFGREGFSFLWKASQKDTIDCMINHDVAKARQILSENKDILCQLIQSAYPVQAPYVKKLFDMVMNGVESVIDNPYDLTTNWNLDNGWVAHSDGHNRNVMRSHDSVVAGDKLK